MPLNVNGYNNEFAAFVKFANANSVGDGTAVARFADTETVRIGTARTIVAADPQLDKVGKSRKQGQMELNDSVRTSFRNAVRDMFGGEAKIPANVKKAMLLADYDKGKPLTARRILAVKAAIDNHLSAPPDKIEIEVRGRTVTFDKGYYERMVEAMPAAERPRGFNGRAELADILRATLSARIENGLRIFHDVRAGRGELHQASLVNVADLTLALHAIALLNGDGFKRGAFSVADSDGRLARWLDTCDELYLRRSTHLESYQNMTVDGHRNILRGIDVPEGRNGLLAGMKTVHYGTIPDMNSATGDGCGPGRRLFLKCETHGIYINPFFRTAAGMSPGMRQRGLRLSDFPESKKHSLSFYGSRGRDPMAGGARKEEITPGVKAALYRADAELKAAGSNNLSRILSAEKSEKGGVMMTIDNARKALASDPDNQMMHRLFNDIVQAARDDMGDKHGDASVRLGNEAMIEDGDIAAFVQPQPPHVGQ